MVTISEIASLAGVSKAAVSKALNNKEDISIETKKRIKKIASELGYNVNIAAKSLSLKRNMAAGLLVTLPEIPSVSLRIHGVQSELMDKGYFPLIAFHDGTLENEIKILQELKGRVDGIIITPTGQSAQLLSIIKSIKCPIVFMSERFENYEADFVCSDYKQAGSMLAEYLISEGHSSCIHFASSTDTYSDREVILGIKSKYNKSFNATNVLWNNTSKRSTVENIKRLLILKPDTTAILAFSDLTALWIIDYLNRMGIKVPEQISVIGYDDMMISSLDKISLTSVYQPDFDIGRESARLLLKRMNKNDSISATQKIIIQPQLRIRGSSARRIKM